MRARQGSKAQKTRDSFFMKIISLQFGEIQTMQLRAETIAFTGIPFRWYIEGPINHGKEA